MGSETESTPPRLSFFNSRPRKPSEVPTPPLQATVSVPFQWEEAPGKPRYRPGPTESKPKSARTLELPPCRLQFWGDKVSNLPSPTTVLDGPYMGRAKSFTSSHSTGLGSKEVWNGNFGSSRWRSFRGNKEEVVEGRFDFSKCDGNGSATKVKITRVKRRGSFFSGISHAKSRLWASIYDSFKQVVPWRRRRQEKQKK